MRIYFVRHGESIFNASRVHQPLHVELSETGEKQAEFVGKRLQQVDFDVIISSDLERAKQTALAIKEATKKELVFTELARERQIPSLFHGKPVDDPSLKESKAIIEENIENPDFRHSDEETFFDLKARAQKLLRYLESRQEETLVVVLHGTILRYTLMTMMLEPETFGWNYFMPFARFLRLNNTGITVCEQQEGHWRLLTWNDHAHLNDIG